MRIAVSGTHCSGKTTLINEFLRQHTDFTHEPEPYEVMVEDYGEEFSAEPCVEDFLRQMEFYVERLSQQSREARVIFERSPVDFLAYILALNDLHPWAIDSSLTKSARQMASQAMMNLDLVVFLPLDSEDVFELPDSEFPVLRMTVDAKLVAIFDNDDSALFKERRPILVEARGSTAERLSMIDSAIDRVPRSS